MKGGGIEAMICALANEMSKTEDVTVCSIFKPTPSDVFWNKLLSTVKKIDLGKIAPGFSLKEIFKVYSLIRDGNYDVVNIHGMFFYYVMPVLFLHRNTKFFYTIHSDAAKENSKWDNKILRIKKMCFRRGYIHPVTISNASQKSFENLYDCASTLIYNGIQKPKLEITDAANVYKINPDTKVFIHAGRIDTPKNQLILCKVFRRLIEDGENVVLIIAGAKQREDIYDSLKPLFCDRIRYIGERNDIPQIMASCYAMCLPSIWEGLPVTLLEALAVGCVPICSSVGGISDVIRTGENGFLSKSPSEIDFYSTMKSFLSLSHDKYLRVRKNCQESFTKYDIYNTAKAYINAYKFEK